MNPTTNTWINEAEAAINRAVTEFQKPSEDVMVFTVCSNATKAARLLLEAYLTQNHIKYDTNAGFVELITLCKKEDPNFKNFDTHAYDCQAMVKNHSNYCLDIDRANKCLELAIDLKNYLKQSGQEVIKN